MLSLEKIQDLIEFDEEEVKVRDNFLNGKVINNFPSSSLMGVINLSSDSWYRESVSLSVDSAIKRGLILMAEGADILDIGAESTLPNADIVEVKKQISLIKPIVEKLSSKGAIISVETYHPEVVKAVLEAGAKIINLTSSINTEEIYKMTASHSAGVIICYIQDGSNPRNVGNFKYGDDYFELLQSYFSTEIEKSLKMNNSNIWLDPGLGFYYKNLMDSSERIRYQMNTLLQTAKLKTLGYPICHAMPHAFEVFKDEVRLAESYFSVLALLGKTDLIRTHEVKKVKAIKEIMSLF